MKAASATTASMGATVQYTLTLKVLGSAAMAVQVNDTLPSQVVFTGFGPPSPSVPGQTMSANGPLLTWSFPLLSPGTYLLPYSVQVNSGLTGTTLVNTAQGSFLGGTSQAVTASVLVPAPIHLTISVYNEAGELVKEIYAQNFSQPVSLFQLSATSITSANGVVSVYVGGVLVATWDGTSADGTPVTNGSYFIKADNIDPLGSVTTVTQEVTVSRSLSTITVAVYNEAGEIVKHLYAQVASSAGEPLQSMSLSAPVIQPGDPAAAGAPSSTTIRMDIPGGGVTLVWDGTNDAGSFVTNGQYFVEAHWVNGQAGGDQTVTQVVSVLNSGLGMIRGQVYAQPNLLTGGQTATLLRVDSPTGLTLKADIYALSGERVGEALGLPGTNQVSWDAGGLASGFYLAVVELRDSGGGMMGRQTTHFVVRR